MASLGIYATWMWEVEARCGRLPLCGPTAGTAWHRRSLFRVAQLGSRECIRHEIDNLKLFIDTVKLTHCWIEAYPFGALGIAPRRC